MELRRIFSDENAEYYDLCSVVFPEGGWELIPDTVDKPLYLLNAVFRGDVVISQKFSQMLDLTNATFNGGLKSFRSDEPTPFEGEVSFHKTTFKGNVKLLSGFGRTVNFQESKFLGDLVTIHGNMDQGGDFTKARFDERTELTLSNRGSLNFEQAHFGGNVSFKNYVFRNGVNFTNARFRGPVCFNNASFGMPPNAEGKTTFYRSAFDDSADFTLASFNHETDFNLASFAKPDKVSFANVDLSLVRFNGCDVSKVLFERVEWGRLKGEFMFRSRPAIYDERLLRERGAGEIYPKDCEAVAQTYRRLQENYGESYRYPEAGGFYIGEREMVRLARSRLSRIFCVDHAYKFVSLYGESYSRSLFLLAFTLAVFFPLLLGISGITYESQDIVLKLVWNSDPTDFVFFSTDYWELIDANLDFITFSRGTANACLDHVWQKLAVKAEIVWVVALVTFFLLALRRRFKRRSF